jgi:hypothetical protein
MNYVVRLAAVELTMAAGYENYSMVINSGNNTLFFDSAVNGTRTSKYVGGHANHTVLLELPTSVVALNS